MPRLFDTHCHCRAEQTNMPDGYDADAGPVSGRLLCGVEPAGWGSVAALSACWSGTVPAFGLHPWHAADAANDWTDRLAEYLSVHPQAWVGESGLDFLKSGIASRAVQEDALNKQLRLARHMERPVNLHCVRAHERLLALLDREYLVDGPRTFLIHSFGGPHQAIEPFRARGAYFSIGPLAWRRDTARIRARVALLPRERVVVESDAFLEPGVDAAEDLAYTVRWLAALWEMDENEAGERIAAATRRMRAHAH